MSASLKCYNLSVKEQLERALARRTKQHLPPSGRIASAVIVPIYLKNGEYHILFTRRTEKVREHKGQISFPGGAYEERDGTLLNTALRECAEEIGLGADRVEILGELDDTATISTNYIISPFVATIPWPYPFKLDRFEAEEIIEVPISALMDKDCVRMQTETVDGEIVPTFTYNYQGKIIWGATARILYQFLDLFSMAATAHA